MRVDMFTTIHKAIRNHLFELARDAARCDLTKAYEVDALVTRVERALEFLEEHAHHEDNHVFPLLLSDTPELAGSLAADHRALEVVAFEVERAAHGLAVASEPDRPEAGAQLVRLVNHLLAVQLVHMGREETEVNAVLWQNHTDAELGIVHGRIVGSIAPARFAEWRELMVPALNPVERAAVIG